MRSLADLTATTDPAWPLVQQWLRDHRNEVEVLAADEQQRGEALWRLQVTTRSPMGAIVFETGGLLIDGGWLRILGSGHARLPRSIPSWNEGRTTLAQGSPPPYLLVADDVVGGFFAVNGGGLPGGRGAVHYFAPDSLEWQDLELGYSEFVVFALSGDLARFYADSRWPGWRAEIDGLPGGSALSIHPFLWAEGPPIAERSRRPVPIAELWSLQQDMRDQLSGER